MRFQQDAINREYIASYIWRESIRKAELHTTKLEFNRFSNEAAYFQMGTASEIQVLRAEYARSSLEFLEASGYLFDKEVHVGQA